MSVSRHIAALLLLTCAACAPDKANPSRAPDSASASATGHGNVRTCGLPGLGLIPRDSAAVRCAEWFVARNGYTDQPPADSSALASESIEYARSLSDLLAQRRNSLARHAAVVCRYGRRGFGYTVGFRTRRHPDDSLGRAVTMDTALKELRVEHMDYLLARARSDNAECRALGGT